MQHTLLPRSTGLHCTLRSLAPRIPSLKLIDVTVAYPGTCCAWRLVALPTHSTGIPRYGYGQSYYTLRSIFFDGVPPPKVHMHIRCFDVAQDVPLGDLSATRPSKIPNGSSSTKGAVEVEIPETEKEIFDKWLREIGRAHV